MMLRDDASDRGTLLILDQSINLRNNTRRLLGQHRSLVWLLLFTVALDTVSTIAFMSILGPGAEQNPVVRHLSQTLGVVVGPPVGKLFQPIAAFALAAITPRLARFVLATVILMNLFAFVFNMHVFLLS